MISTAVNVPVIACGGAGKLEHILEVIQKARADAVCCASIFHYQHLEAVNSTEEFKEEGNIEFIRFTRGSMKYMSDRMQPSGIPLVKKFLENVGVACRPAKLDTVNAA